MTSRDVTFEIAHDRGDLIKPLYARSIINLAGTN
jgi:hypothetical protein